MPRLSLWNSGRKGNDYKFFDRQISEMFNVGGTIVLVHKYIGPLNADGTAASVTTIQDPLFVENRDRSYDPVPIPLYGVYNVQDAEFDLRQFGLFLDNDTLFLSFHYNDMIMQFGRKIISGDVLELPHLRDNYMLDDGPSLNKYYLVTDANRSSEGYSPTWWQHVWRVKVSPMPNSQEFSDILDNPSEDQYGGITTPVGGTTGDGTTYPLLVGLNEQIDAAAKANVPKRNFETQQFYVMLSQPNGAGGYTNGDETCGQNPWIFAGDGIPPDGAALAGSGTAFPTNPTDGEYFLRTDYEPHVLFRYRTNTWTQQELDYRKADWSMAHRILETFIDNDRTTTYDDRTVHPEKVALSKAIRPSADF